MNHIYFHLLWEKFKRLICLSPGLLKRYVCPAWLLPWRTSQIPAGTDRHKKKLEAWVLSEENSAGLASDRSDRSCPVRSAFVGRSPLLHGDIGRPKSSLTKFHPACFGNNVGVKFLSWMVRVLRYWNRWYSGAAVLRDYLLAQELGWNLHLQY